MSYTRDADPGPVIERDPGRYAIASRFVSSLYVTYPSFDVWRSLYHPDGATSGRDMYESMRRSHEKSTFKELSRIHNYVSGRNVLRQLAVTKGIVEIYPWVFEPPSILALGREFTQSKFAFRTKDLKTMGEHDYRNITTVTLKGEVVCVNGGQRGAICVTGTGEGSGANVFITPSQITGKYMADDLLLHELVHAGRVKLGIMNLNEKVGHYPYEEFIATLIQNIYRSERGHAPYDYDGHPIHPKTFMTPEARKAIIDLSRQHTGQPVLFDLIAKINCAFNPIREVAGF